MRQPPPPHRPLIFRPDPADNTTMNENWYGSTSRGNFLTDTLIPCVFACIPAASLVYGLILWLKSS
jgi:hypothetical protein